MPNAALVGPATPGDAILMPKCGNKLNVLPSFIVSLSKKYFATLFGALFASEHPFDHFKKNSAQFLTISRTAFQHVWPELDTQLEVDDILFNVVSPLAWQHLLFYLSSCRAINVFSKSVARFTKPLSRTWNTTSSPKTGLRRRLRPGLNGFAARMEVPFSTKRPSHRMAYGIERTLDMW